MCTIVCVGLLVDMSLGIEHTYSFEKKNSFFYIQEEILAAHWLSARRSLSTGQPWPPGPERPVGADLMRSQFLETQENHCTSRTERVVWGLIIGWKPLWATFVYFSAESVWVGYVFQGDNNLKVLACSHFSSSFVAISFGWIHYLSWDSGLVQWRSVQ